MGRYAYFNTDFEYKFWFGIQPSSDVLKFGGIANFTNDTHSWSEKDKKQIYNILQDMVDAYDLPVIQFDMYDISLEGTCELYSYLHYNSGNPNQLATYILGCIIYHQLLYEPNLTCSYEN